MTTSRTPTPEAGTPGTPGTARRTQAERRAETERRVLGATLQLIAEGGTRAVTLARVGEAAGYSRGIVTHQFGSRDELLARAAQYAQATLPAPETDLRGLDQLLLTLRTYLVELRRKTTATRAFLQMWAEAVTSEPALRRVFVERDAHFRALLEGYLADGLAAGTVRAGTDPAATAALLVTHLRGAGLQLMLTGDEPAFDAAGAALLALVEQGLATTGQQSGSTLHA